jgi:hypothetical protein
MRKRNVNEDPVEEHQAEERKERKEEGDEQSDGSWGPVLKRTEDDALCRVGLQKAGTELIVLACEDIRVSLAYPCGGPGSDSLARPMAHLNRLPVVNGKQFWAAFLSRSFPCMEGADPERLTKVVLARSKLGPEEAAWIAEGLAKNPKLTYLDLSSNELGEEGVASIGRGLAPNTHLRTLRLGDVQDKDDATGQ